MSMNVKMIVYAQISVIILEVFKLKKNKFQIGILTIFRLS